MLRCEEEILRWRMEHPQPAHPRSDIKAPTATLRWRGSMLALMELICALFYGGCIVDSEGERASFASVVAAFCHLFDFPIDRPYDMRARLAQRKKRLSVLLPKLKTAFEQNIVRCGITPR